MGVNLARRRAAKAARRRILVEAKRKAERRVERQVADWGFGTLPSQKASAALLDIAEPWLFDAEGRDARYNILMLVMTAWNLSLIPVEERKARLREIVEKVLEGADDDLGAVAEFEAVIGELVSRKLLLYPLDRRFLLNLDLVETSDGYRVNVMSELSKAT